jgi:hypothetical protein
MAAGGAAWRAGRGSREVGPISILTDLECPELLCLGSHAWPRWLAALLASLGCRGGHPGHGGGGLLLTLEWEAIHGGSWDHMPCTIKEAVVLGFLSREDDDRLHAFPR